MGGAGASVGQADREGGREEKNGRWGKTEGKRERSLNSNQRSGDLRIECEHTRACVCVHTCARVSASPPSFTFTDGAADQTALNKRKPFPSLLRSQRTCARAVEWLSVHTCVQQRMATEGGDRREAAHIILRASSGWSPLRIMAHSAKQQWERRAFVHISIRCAFSLHQTNAALSMLPVWPFTRQTPGAPLLKHPPPTAAQEVGAPLCIGIIKELFTPAGNKPYL